MILSLSFCCFFFVCLFVKNCFPYFCQFFGTFYHYKLHLNIAVRKHEDQRPPFFPEMLNEKTLTFTNVYY